MHNKQLVNTLGKLVTFKPDELRALLISATYFYLLLCAYYVFRPIRNEMVIANGVDNIQWLLLMTSLVLLLITPIFGWVTSRYKTRQFLSYCTAFFVLNLVIFYVLFNVGERPINVTRAFYVWVNVFNMFIVSLFWSFMNDIFSQAQTKRLFAFIAAGGTAGALTGPIITTLLVEKIGLSYLLLISACILSLTLINIKWLTAWKNDSLLNQTKISTSQQTNNTEVGQALKGSIWGGFTLIVKSPYLLGICGFITLYAVSITFIEIQQAEFIAASYDSPTERTKLFSQIDLSANAIALVFQLFVTSHIIKWIGYRSTLMLIPVGITIGFGIMIAAPILPVMIAIQVFRRAGDYAIMKPTREMLFSVVDREEKYKAKNFIDTAILRTGNTSSAWIYTGFKSLGASPINIMSVCLFLGTIWCAISYWLGGQFNNKAAQTSKQATIKPN